MKILTQLLSVAAFNEYSVGYSFDVNNIHTRNPKEFLEDTFCQAAVKVSPSLSYLCISGESSALAVKKRHINIVKSYLIKEEIVCTETIKQMYSKNNPKYMEKVGSLTDDIRRGIIKRQQYLKALSKIRIFHEVNIAISDRFESEIDYGKFKMNSRTNTDVNKIYRHYASIMAKTQRFVGREKPDKYLLPSLAIDLREQVKETLEALSTPASDDFLKFIWVKHNERILSNNNLGRLVALLVKAYKSLYTKEIVEYSNTVKKNNDRRNANRDYIQKKIYSKTEKLQFIKSNLTLTNSELATVLDCSERSIRNLLQCVDNEASEKNIVNNIQY